MQLVGARSDPTAWGFGLSLLQVPKLFLGHTDPDKNVCEYRGSKDGHRPAVLLSVVSLQTGQ